MLIIHNNREIGYTKRRIDFESTYEEDYIDMGTIIILGVSATFLAAIFTAGYNNKPGTNKD